MWGALVLAVAVAEPRALQDCASTDKVTLQLKWLIQAQFMGYLAAREIGGPFGNMYKQECILCQIRSGDPLIDPITEVLDGFSDIAVVPGSSFIEQVVAGAPLTGIGALHHSNGMVLVALRDFCGRDDCVVADLSGQTVAMSRDAEAPVRKFLGDLGVDVVYVSKFFGVAQLLDGTWAASGLMMFNEVGLIFESVNPKTGFLYTLSDLIIWDGLQPQVDEVLVMRNDVLAAKGPAVQRFLRAQAKAWHYCRVHEEECVAMLPNPDRDHQRFMLREINRIMYPKPDGFGHYSEDVYWSSAKTLADFGFISALPATFAVNNSLMDAATAALRLDPAYADLDGLDWAEPVVEMCARKGGTWSVCQGFQAVLCPAGHAPSGDGVCAACPAGTYAPEEDKGNVCELCLPGQSSARGASRCSACPEGQFASSPGSVCEPCLAGQYSTWGSADCAECPAGTQSTAGAAACTLCPPGTFGARLDGQGATACTQCSGGMSTMRAGSEAATACTCAEGTFWNRRDDVCDKCPAESFCAGGLHLPVVYEGNYGKYLGSLENREEEERAKRRGDYVAQAGSFFKMEVYKCSGFAHCPGKTLSFDFSRYGVDSVSADFVHHGYPLVGACPVTDDPLRGRVGIACGRCQDGHFGTRVECSKCEGAAMVVNGIIVVLMPFIMMCIYRVTASSGTQRVQAAFILVSTFGMAAFFMQTIAVLDTFAFSWPDELAWLFVISRVFMFDLQALSFSCMHGESFGAKYWASMLIPMALGTFTLIGFAISKALPEKFRMLPNQTFSMLGMLLSALYVTLVKVVVAFFECPENPAAEPTLAKYKDVVCGSDDHNAGLPAMVLGLLIYVLGLYSLFLRAAYLAPSYWMDVGFRERWKFMLTRWRPDVWFWGCVMMTRNLLVAFGGFVSNDPRVQLVYVICIVTFAFSVSAIYQPWRAAILNHYDVASSIVLCFIGISGLIFVSLQEEVGLCKRFDLMQSVASKEAQLKTFASALTFLIGIFGAMFGMLAMWCVSLMLPSQAAKNLKAYEENWQKLVAKLESCVKRPDFCQEAGRIIREATTYDRAGLENFLNKVFADQRTVASGSTDTISLQRAKDLMVAPKGPQSAVVSA